MDLESARRFGQQKVGINRSFLLGNKALAEAVLANGTPTDINTERQARLERLRSRFNALAEKVSSTQKSSRLPVTESRHRREASEAVLYSKSRTIPVNEEEPEGDKLRVSLEAEFSEFSQGSSRRAYPKYIKVSWDLIPSDRDMRELEPKPFATEELWSYNLGGNLDKHERLIGLLEQSVDLVVDEPAVAISQ